MKTNFIDVNDMIHLIHRHGLTTILADLVDCIESDFKRWEKFDKSARVASHSDVGVIELMPTADDVSYAFKYVNGHPQNTQHDLSTVMSFGVLAEVQTGFPVLMSEFTLATAIRTAAQSVMSARLLARKDARSMALIGNGAQSEFQAIAFHHVLGINEVRLFDIDNEATDKLVDNLKAFPNLKIIRASSTADAVRGADIVTTVTADKAYATIITSEMIEPGMHLNAVGGDCPGKTELHADVLLKGKVFVEFEPQSRIEGDIQQMPADFPVIELWQVLNGQINGRDDNDQITIFDSVGFALEDFSTLAYVHKISTQYGIGRTIDLIPEFKNPKDLFGFIRQGTTIQENVA